jgi:tetratricopeptide (TPR) repeat protein
MMLRGRSGLLALRGSGDTFAPMYSTDQFRVFPGEPADHALSRPRRLLQEGRLDAAEEAYRGVLATDPGLKQAWLECFELLRHARRHEEALSLAQRARDELGEDALPLALRGAALVELGRFREGLAALETAATREPDLGLIWHEAGYAAYRLGELSRALMALDRAFALEPHSGTLHLRGKVLREAGRYLAAEVAFEGAAEAAEFPAQRQAAEREVRSTRRYAAFPGRRPDVLPPGRRWFAEHGAVPLALEVDAAGASDAGLAEAFIQFFRDERWRFSHLIAIDHWNAWSPFAEALGLPVRSRLPDDPMAVPLLVAERAEAGEAVWQDGVEQIERTRRGLSFAIRQDTAATPGDVFGRLGERTVAVDLAFATEATQHPAGRLAGRILRAEG